MRPTQRDHPGRHDCAGLGPHPPMAKNKYVPAGIDILACGHLDRGKVDGLIYDCYSEFAGVECGFCVGGNDDRMRIYQSNQIRKRWAGGQP